MENIELLRIFCRLHYKYICLCISLSKGFITNEQFISKVLTKLATIPTDNGYIDFQKASKNLIDLVFAIDEENKISIIDGEKSLVTLLDRLIENAFKEIPSKDELELAKQILLNHEKDIALKQKDIKKLLAKHG